MTLRQVPTWASQMQKEDKSNEIRSCADLNTVEDNLKDRVICFLSAGNSIMIL